MQKRYDSGLLFRKISGKREKNRGFTLVEMIVTLVVLTIVVSLSVAGVLSWQDWSNFKKENEYAQVLFVAAQNQLTEFRCDGRLQKLQESLSGGGLSDEIGSGDKQYEAVGLNLTDSIGLLKDEQGQAYSSDTLFPESAGKTDAQLYQNEIVSLRAETGEYASYLQDPEALRASNPEAYWVFELLGAYVYDTAILNGSRKGDGSGDGAAICVELTPEDGQIFSVLYSDKNDRFIYMGVAGDKNGTAEGSGIADISDRTQTYRKERMVGYYGVDTLYASTSSDVIQPSIASVRLYNKDTFYMTFRLSARDRQKLTSRLTYVLDLDGSKNVSDKKLTIKLDGTKLKNEAHAEKINCPVTRYEADGTETMLGEFPVLAWVETDYTVHVLLDGADIQATTDLYASELTTIRSTEEGKAATAKFAGTNSFFRFGAWADNVYASVTATGAGFMPSRTVSNFGNLNILKNQGEKHTCFAGEKQSENAGKIDFVYSVINARHLYNIRYIEDLSYEEQAGSTEAADKIGGVQFGVKADIDWKAFTQEGKLFDSYQTASNLLLSSLDGRLVAADGSVIAKVTRYNCDFPSFAQLRERDSIDGNGKTITGISVSEISNALYGLYFVEKDGVIQMDESRPTGFVNINYGQIKDVTLDQITARGNDFVGGFCGINAGELEGLRTLHTGEKSLIAGKSHVGGIAGFFLPSKQEQVAENLVNRAAVEGVTAVGGIFGMVRNAFSFDGFDAGKLKGIPAATKNLLLTQADTLRLTVQKCENYGTVSGVNASQLCGIYTAGQAGGTQQAGTGKTVAAGTASEGAIDEATQARYIGGIVGYCYNQNKDTDKLQIISCTSAPQYKGDSLLAILSDETLLAQHLKGVYVGGIVGYNYFGQISNSATRPEKGQYGCLFGYRYVGGIVGFNIGPASGIVGSDTTKQGENDNHVIAYEYAGGITGCNANVRDEDSLGNSISADGAKDPEKLQGLLLADSGRNLHVKVDNWVNKGIVIATHAYAGGITGYNAGYIYRCNSDVESDVADTYFAKMTCGDYAGGIAGYNNGVIGNTERSISADGSQSTVVQAGTKFSTVCYVMGHHYVGGIVGYNDVDSIVEDYEIASGYVLGGKGSCFVGGYAGLNASVDLLMNLSLEDPKPRFIHSNPNHVKGDYFVGGNIGGNLINMADNSGIDRINGVFKTDNFLGILEGKAFVGGFVGYNLLFDNNEETGWIKNDAENYRGAVYIVQRELIDAFETSDASVSDVQKALIEKKEILDDLAGGLQLEIMSSDKKVCISGMGADTTKVSFGTISGELYVGGVLGYNDENTYLTIQNVENATPVEATNAIVYAKEQVEEVDEATGKESYRTTDYIGNAKTYTYSYAGGMLGKVSKNTVLDNCWNASSGTVTTKGTYTGGLCEINEGMIKNCKVSNFGSSVEDYVGGLCGLNKSTIKECAISKKTVSGRNVVGGITAENYGTISAITLENAKLLTEGRKMSQGQKHGVCGMYAGYNGTTGIIELSEDLTKITITSGGRYVGAVAGINAGSVKNKKIRTGEAADLTDNLVIDGTIRGYQTVGGLFGLNNCQDTEKAIAHYTNEAAVTATNGYAGGIIGENASDNTIRYCINRAVVAASDAGNAGGITSYNNGVIRDCYDYKAVTAPEGMCGGITAVNEKDGSILDCHVQPMEGQSAITFRSTKVVGGIAAQNAGKIQNNTLQNVTITNETTKTGTSMGIVAGENLAGGWILLAASSAGNDPIRECKVAVQSNYSKAGGIAGTNAGTVLGTTDAEGMPASVVNSKISMENANVASIGGVVGTNTGRICNIAVDAHLQGDLGSASEGYGGIAGTNGYFAQAAAKQATNSTGKEYPSEIINCTFDGYLNAIGSSGAPARIGGITGINGYGAKVEDCAIGTRQEEDPKDGSENRTKETYVTAGDLSKTAESVKTTDTKSFSNLGGIAGDNYGLLSACDNAGKSEDAVHIIGFAGEAGGIAGFNYASGIVSGYMDENGDRHYLTTGKDWEVEQRCCANDRGPGGIIGKTTSAEDICYVKNYASVTCLYQANTYIGGIAGIVEIKHELSVRLIECENYGNISSSRSSGGFIGFLLGCGATFENCTNWGDVTATTLRSGGFVALQYTAPQSCEFRHCANHGNISVTNVTDSRRCLAGFLADQMLAYKVDNIEGNTYFYDCVNTGLIRDEKNQSLHSNFGVFGGKLDAAAYLELCRNYNTDTSSANGFVGTGSSNTFLKNCLDNSNCQTKNTQKTPFGGVLRNTVNAYYLDEHSASTFLHDSYGVYFNLYEGGTNNSDTWGNIRYFDKAQYAYLCNPSVYFSEPSRGTQIRLDSKSPTLWINLSYEESSEGLDSFVVYLWNGRWETDSVPSSPYGCQATYYYEDGSTQTTEWQEKAGYFDICDETKVVLKNPRTDDKKPNRIKLSFTGGKPVPLRGFSFIPQAEAASQKEAVCTYLGEKNDTTFNITAVTKTKGEVTTNVNAKPECKFGWNEKRYLYSDDLLSMDWEKYSCFYYKFYKGDWVDVTFAVSNGKNAPGMDAFAFYLANDNDNPSKSPELANIHYYDYYVTFTDENGKTADTETVHDAVGYDSGVSDYMEKSKQVVKVPDGLSDKIASITVHIVSTKYSYVKNGVRQDETNSIGYIYLRGFAWIPKGQTLQKMAPGVHPDAKLSAFDTEEVVFTQLKVDLSGEKPYVYAPRSYQLGFFMDHAENNPIAEKYYGDDTTGYRESLTQGENSGSRIDTYLDLDPKYVELAKEASVVYRKLKTPTNLKTKETNSFLRFSWDKVNDAYAYEVYYQVLDAEDQPVYTSEQEMIGSLQRMYDISAKEDWPKDGKIVFYIRAINAYHMMHDDPESNDYDEHFAQYDSDWVCSDGDTVKKALPRPMVHLEIIAGDETVAVLDNYEEYEAQGCTDCTVFVKYRGQDLNIDLSATGKFSEPKFVNVPEGTGQDDLIYYAKPNESLADTYTNSASVKYRGEGLGNNTLPKRDMYCATYYQGFYGTDPDNMEYRITYRLKDQDSYVLSDISTYDEKVGATVAYDHEITHTANSYSGGGNLELTSTLKNLPQEWFSEEHVSKVTVRAYPYRSQFEMFHYGHEVTQGIRLDGTAEENAKVLAGIFDENYFAAGADMPASNCIWDAAKKDMKDGYVLQRQADGSYDVYYSAVIESSLQAAAVRRTDNSEPYREYYNYGVGYAIYSDMDTETNGSICVNSKDFQESYWVRRMEADGGNHKNYNHTVTNTDDRLLIQERQSIPIVEDEVTAGSDASGHMQYTFKWDTYYKDTKSPYTNTQDTNKLTKAPKGLFATWDAYLDRLTKANLANPSKWDRCHLMNAYYNSYSSAKYRVDLIGTTLDGKDVILDTLQVDSPTKLSEMTTMTDEQGNEVPLTMLDNKTTTTYQIWDYECTFTDSNHVWDTYPILTARVIRLGSLQSIKSDNNAPKTDGNGAIYLLPRYTEKEIQVKLRLGTISKPVVTLRKEDGKFITDDLIYEISWGAITEDRQKQDLGGYLIKAVLQGEEDAQQKKTHYYYVTDVAASGDTIGLDLDELAGEGIVTDVSAQYEKTDDTCKTLLNLSDFNTDDVVELSVRAIARSHATYYTDGAEGVPTELVIPSRLMTPDVGKLQCTVSDNSIPSEDFTVNMETYERGFAFRYEAGSYPQTATAQLQMAVAVYEEKPEDAQGDTAMITQEWDAQAAKTLFTREEACNLGYASASGAVTLSLPDYERYPGEFAGKWLKIALQATCPTEIDSQWTDLDPDGLSTNYLWIPIPKLQLSAVNLQEASVTDPESGVAEGDIIRYYLDGNIYNTSQDENKEIKIACKTLTFAEDKNVDGYHIRITEAGLPETQQQTTQEQGGADAPGNAAEETQTAVSDLYLERHSASDGETLQFDGTWDLFLAGAAAEGLETEITGCLQDQSAVYIGNIGRAFANADAAEGEGENACMLVEMPQLQRTYEMLQTLFTMTMQLRYDEEEGAKTGRFSLVLPDVTAFAESPHTDTSVGYTQQIAISQYLKEDAAYTAGADGVYESTAEAE